MKLKLLRVTSKSLNQYQIMTSIKLKTHAHLLSENVYSREDTSTFSVIPKQNPLSQ
jgi:hypothetical protein